MKEEEGIGSSDTTCTIPLVGEEEEEAEEFQPLRVAISEDTVATNHQDEKDGDSSCDDGAPTTVQESITASREACTAIIRDHLASFLEQNPDASYITWIATLHPENAEVVIDRRFLIPGNPWWAVYEEAKRGVVLQIPSPIAVEEDERDTLMMNNGYMFGGLVPLMIGFTNITAATLTAASLQATSTFLYLTAAGCAKVCGWLRMCRRNSVMEPLVIVIYMLFLFLMNVFRLLDCLLLIIDIFVAEILAAISLVLCGLFALSYHVGLGYHQKTRRLAHFIRWACRKPFHGVHPPRAYFLKPLALFSSHCGNDNDNNNNNNDTPRGVYVRIADGDSSSAGGIP